MTNPIKEGKRNVKTISKLNFGCGNDIRNDFWNVDLVKTNGTDQSFDFNIFPYPLPEEHYEYILAKQVFEHLDDVISVIYEMYRLLRPGGILEIATPYWTSPNAWVHPQHKREFNYETFDYFVRDTLRNRIDGHWVDTTFTDINTHIIFYKRLLPWNHIIEPIVNICRNTSLLYEYTFLHNLFPADGINYRLMK